MKSKKNIGEIKPQTVTTIILIAGGIITFDLLSKLLQSLGIWQSNDSKSLDNIAATANSPWNPNFYTQYTNYTYAISTAQATDLANKIYNAMGIFNDCEDCVKSVFYSLKTQTEVSFLVKVFADIYNQDLLSYLRGGIWPQDHLSDSDVAEINKYILALPKS